jgi:signal transduction histidine kinase
MSEERVVAVVRRTAPVSAVCLCAVGTALGDPLYAWYFAMLLALGVAATVTRDWTATAAVVVAFVAPFGSVPTRDRGLLLGLISTLVWAACRWRARAEEQRTQRAAAERAAAAAHAVYDERLRIARDLHDMVSHGMSVITIQAEYGALSSDRDPTAPLRALEVVQETGHETLRQLRQMVDVLRSPDHDADEAADPACLNPAPGLGDLRDLLARTAAGGVRVEYDEQGDVRVAPPDVGLCVYRVVQEGVANVLQHSGVGEARLEVHVTDDEVGVRLTNGPGMARAFPGASARSGHGLVGIRERVQLLGGTTEAGATADGGYDLEVHIPVSSRMPAT